MITLKTNTATRITVGPFLAVADGITPVTSMTVTNCTCELFHNANDGGAVTRAALTLSASGGNNDMVHITDDVGGYFDLELTAANVNWLGNGRLSIIDTDVHLPVFIDIQVLPANVWDSLYAGTDKLAVDTQEISGDATAADNCELMFDGTGYAGGTAKLGVDAVAISGDTTAADNLEAAHDGTGYAGGTIKQKVDLETIKTQAVTCGAGVTVLASVGTAATSTAQTGDAYARLGAPAGASVSADVAAVKTDTGAIKTMTDKIGTVTNTGGTATIGAILGDMANSAVVTRLAAINAKTTNLPPAPAATGDIPTAAAVADAVCDEALAGHTTAGTVGKALADASSAGDPWSTALPGAYGAGTAGKIIGDNVNAPIATIDTVVDAIKAKTDNLPTHPQKNVALSNISFKMFLSSDHVTPATGKTVTGTTSKDAGAFGAISGTITEISNGWYKLDAASQSEMNGNQVVFEFSAADCDITTVEFFTST